MKGLRKQESLKFERYFEIVQSTAFAQECVFFLDAGGGRDFENEAMEGEDIVGWLVPMKEVDEFERCWEKDSVWQEEKWQNMYCWAIWHDDGDLTIKFEYY